MPRGGSRRGTPGKGYSNRTDLGMSPDMSQNTAATGGMAPPALVGPPPATPPMPSRSPDDSPNLTDPTNRPNQPVTAGSDFGPGPDSSILGMKSYPQQRQADVDVLKQSLPELEAATQFDNVPETFKGLVNYLRAL